MRPKRSRKFDARTTFNRAFLLRAKAGTAGIQIHHFTILAESRGTPVAEKTALTIASDPVREIV